MSKKTIIPGPPVGYTDLLDYEITAKLEEEKRAYSTGEKKRYYPLRPSAAGYCARRLAFELMEYHGYAEYDRPVKEPNVYRLLELGNTIEWSVLRQFDLIKLVGIKYKQQVVRCFKLNQLDAETTEQLIEGSCDLCLFSDQYKCIMDIKSVKDAFSKAFPTKWTETLDKYARMKSVQVISDSAFYVEDPRKFIKEIGEDYINENIYQLNLYACTDFMKEAGVDHASIYKYNKNDSRHYELRFKPCQELAEEVEAKYNTIHECVERKAPEEVPAGFTLGSMHCAHCWCNKMCWPEDDSLRSWFKTFKPKKWPKDLNRLDDYEELKELFEVYESLEAPIKDRGQIELRINNLLERAKESKVKLDNGHVYELKFLKSPKPHLELRRSKL